MENRKKIWRWALIITILIFIYLIFFVRKPIPINPKWGVTFSEMQAKDLGLNWQETYLKILDDLGVRYLRLTADWNAIEPQPGQFTWSDLDWQMNEAAKRGAKVNLAIGEKTPRWPECHYADWVWKLGEQQRQQAVLDLLKAIVERYKESPALYRWQVENERLFNFGVCPQGSFSFLSQELKFVKQLDPNHQVMTSDAGEPSTWLRTAAISDVLPVSLYRVVWTKHFGYFVWPLTPTFYFYHASLVSFLVPEVIISELQGEPWSSQPLAQTSLAEQNKSMNQDIFVKNIAFARETGFPEIYFWGVEWWSWMKEKNNQPFFWDNAKQLFNKSL